MNIEIEVWDEADGKGIDDVLAAGKTLVVLNGEKAGAYIAEIATAPSGDAKYPDDLRHPSQATRLADLAADAELFHTPEGEAFATVPVADHRETWPLKSKGFRLWLRRQYYFATGEAPNAQALQDALGVLESKALFDGPEHRVFVRVGEADGAYYVDLANDRWEVVEITAAGWRMIPNPPVKFLRMRGMLPLPHPVAGGDIRELRPFVNVASNADFILLVSALIAYLRPRGPFRIRCRSSMESRARPKARRSALSAP